MENTLSADAMREAIKKYLEDPEHNLYELSMKSGAHRTSLKNFLDGKDIMLSSLEKIVPYVRISE